MIMNLRMELFQALEHSLLRSGGRFLLPIAGPHVHAVVHPPARLVGEGLEADPVLLGPHAHELGEPREGDGVGGHADGGQLRGARLAGPGRGRHAGRHTGAGVVSAVAWIAGRNGIIFDANNLITVEN